jgi:hypothetical protein
MRIGVAFVAVATAVWTSAGLAGARETGLRLLVPADPPFVLDVDSGAVTRVRGVPVFTRGIVTVLSVGGHAGVVVADGGAAADLYAVGAESRRAIPLGTGTHAWPAAGGGSVWVQSRASGSGCRLRQVGLDGRLRRAQRRFPCATGSDPPGGSLGLVVRRTRVVDPRTGRTVLRAPAGILAVAGKSLVLLDAKRLSLLDAATGAERQLGWPSTLGHVDRPAVDPRGRYVVLAFAQPTGPDDGQTLDLWLLDIRMARLSRLPGMPVFVALKRTSLAWTDDGRLVLLGEQGGTDVVAVWRPGDSRLRLRAVDLPAREPGSDSFAPLR